MQTLFTSIPKPGCGAERTVTLIPGDGIGEKMGHTVARALLHTCTNKHHASQLTVFVWMGLKAVVD